MEAIRDLRRNALLVRSALCDWSNEAVTELGQSFDVARLIGVIFQRFAQLFDGSVDAVLEVNKSVGGPQSVAEFFPRYQFAGMFEQDGQNLERHFLELDLAAVMAQFVGGEVGFEGAETGMTSLCGGYLHGQLPTRMFVLTETLRPLGGSVNGG